MPTTSRLARTRTAALLALALPLLAACGGDGGSDPVAPVASLDVSAAQLDELAHSLERVSGQPVFAAFLLARIRPGLPIDFGDVFVDSLFMPFVAARGNVVAAPATVAPQLRTRTVSIPDSVRGRTYVVDSLGFLWRLDTLADGSPRPGAPAAGVRFVLTSYFGFGDAPHGRLGWLDVTQQGAGTAATFAVDVYDTAGVHVQHHAASLAGPGGGWTQGGQLRIDQSATFGTRTGLKTRWTSTSVAVDAQREEFVGSPQGLTTVHTLVVGGRRLRLVALEQMGASTRSATYTIYADEAPFARRQDTMSMLGGGIGTWRHLADARPLNAGELAQVHALVRALVALPDSEVSWQEGLMDLMMLTTPFVPY